MTTRQLLVAVVIVSLAGMGIGLSILAADPPVKPVPSKVEGERATDGVAVNNSQASREKPPGGEPCNPMTGEGCAQEFSQPSRGPADKYNEIDPAFSKYVELSLLTAAVAGPDASALADVALGLAEGERVLARTHRGGLTAEGLMARTVKLAARAGDKATLDRIARAATTANKPQWAKLVAEAKEFGGASRDGPMVAVGKIDVATVTLMESVQKACDVAGLTGRRAELEELKKAISASGIDAKVKAYLVDQIDGCEKSVPQTPDEVHDLLKEFSGASRAVPAVVVAYLAQEAASIARQFATGWHVDYGPRLEDDGDFTVTFKNTIRGNIFGIPHKETYWVQIWGNLNRGGWRYQIRGALTDAEKRLIERIGASIIKTFEKEAARIAREVKRLMDNGPPPPPPPSGPRVGQLVVKNNYDAYVTVRLYHPASPDRVFAEWPIPLTLEQRLVYDNKDMYIGSDWQIQVVFGKGVTSPKRLVGQVGSYQQGMFRVAASDIYNGR